MSVVYRHPCPNFEKPNEWSAETNTPVQTSEKMSLYLFKTIQLKQDEFLEMSLKNSSQNISSKKKLIQKYFPPELLELSL